MKKDDIIMASVLVLLGLCSQLLPSWLNRQLQSGFGASLLL